MSSITSTVSSRYSSSSTSRSSLSLRALISRSWSSESSSSVNTSAASSLGSRRKTRTVSSGPSSSRNSAMSTSFISIKMARSLRNCLVCTSSISCSSSYFSCIRLSPLGLKIHLVGESGTQKSHRALCLCGCYERQSAPRDRRPRPRPFAPLAGSSRGRAGAPWARFRRLPFVTAVFLLPMATSAFH